MGYFDIRRKGCVFTLTIVEAFVEDEGEYRCVVKNGGGEAKAKCQLFIEAPPPRILSELVDQISLEGSDFTLEIKAIGEIAEYAWFKDGIIIKPCEEFQMGKDTEKIWLKVKNAVMTDSGAYSVSISNGVDIMECSCNVTVEPKQELVQRKPQLTKKLQGIVKVVEGSTIKLEVEVLKNAGTTCTWFKSGVPIEHSDKFQVWHAEAMEVPVKSVLILMNLTLDDAAEYTFRASNELGECATSATIIVQRSESVPDELPAVIKPQIFGQIQPATANEKIHDEICLEVQFQGYPTPQTQWFFKGIALLPNVKYDVTLEKTSSKLTIREPVPKDEGEYTFTTTTEFGTAEASGKLTVIPAPPPPAPPVAKDKSGRPKIKRGEIPSMEYMLEWSSFEEEDEPLPMEKVIYRPPPDDFTVINDGELTFPTPPKERTLQKQKFQQVEMPAESDDVAKERREQYPVIMTRMQNQTVKEGEPVRFFVEFVAWPVPKVVWYREGREIELSDFFKFSSGDGHCELNIKQALLLEEGTFHCKIINKNGYAMTKASLTVLPKGNAVALPPRFISQAPNVMGYETQVLRLTAQVLSDSPAKVKWFRNKKQITEETDKYRFDEEGDSHSLLVTDAVLRDSGMYEATAENSRGITKIVGKLLVKSKLKKVAQKKPEFLLKPR